MCWKRKTGFTKYKSYVSSSLTVCVESYYSFYINYLEVTMTTKFFFMLSLLFGFMFVYLIINYDISFNDIILNSNIEFYRSLFGEFFKEISEDLHLIFEDSYLNMEGSYLNMESTNFMNTWGTYPFSPINSRNYTNYDLITNNILIKLELQKNWIQVNSSLGSNPPCIYCLEYPECMRLTYEETKTLNWKITNSKVTHAYVNTIVFDSGRVIDKGLARLEPITTNQYQLRTPWASSEFISLLRKS